MSAPPVDSRLRRPFRRCIVPLVTALWRRRPVRHVAFGLIPLLVVGPIVIILLAVRLADESAPVRAATAKATATVQRSGLGDDRRGIELTWTDSGGTPHTSTVQSARPSNIAPGSQVVVRYQPNDPGTIFVNGDEVTRRLTDLTFGIVLSVLLVLGVLAVSAAHVARRRIAERRPATSMPVSYTRSRFGIIRRAWLQVEDAGRTWWVSVHWDPVLETLAPGEKALVHGNPARDRVVTFDIDGTHVWQAGRRRSRPPRGEVDREGVDPQRTDRVVGTDIPLTRQFRVDAGVLAAAPILGLLWAYVDDGGKASFLLATVLAGAALFWVPTVRGSDPT
jgi:uncharacterized protein DUF3592